MGDNFLESLITSPTYTATVPSTKKEFKYRAYTVGEEQILLTAKESQDSKIILDATKQIIHKCTYEELSPEELASFDIEYILLLLRSKSVGELIEFKLPCAKCEKETDLSLDLNSVQPPVVPKNGNIVKLNDTVSLMMKYPGFDAIESLANDEVDVFDLMANLIDAVVKGEDLRNGSDFSHDELTSFLRNLNSRTLKKVVDYIMNSPQLEHKMDWVCIHCQEKNVFQAKSLTHFFS